MTIGILAFFVVHLLQVARAGWGNLRAMVTGYEIEHPDDLDLSASTTIEPDVEQEVEA